MWIIYCFPINSTFSKLIQQMAVFLNVKKLNNCVVLNRFDIYKLSKNEEMLTHWSLKYK